LDISTFIKNGEFNVVAPLYSPNKTANEISIVPPVISLKKHTHWGVQLDKNDLIVFDS
jgi:hypothetical protein